MKARFESQSVMMVRERKRCLLTKYTISYVRRHVVVFAPSARPLDGVALFSSNMPGIADMLRMQPFTTSLNSHRILLYTLISTIAVSAAIANALKNHSNFYSVAIYLSKSNRSVLVCLEYNASMNFHN
jgi:hypothetical protein